MNELRKVSLCPGEIKDSFLVSLFQSRAKCCVRGGRVSLKKDFPVTNLTHSLGRKTYKILEMLPSHLKKFYFTTPKLYTKQTVRGFNLLTLYGGLVEIDFT